MDDFVEELALLLARIELFADDIATQERGEERTGKAVTVQSTARCVCRDLFHFFLPSSSVVLFSPVSRLRRLSLFWPFWPVTRLQHCNQSHGLLHSLRRAVAIPPDPRPGLVPERFFFS